MALNSENGYNRFRQEDLDQPMDENLVTYLEQWGVFWELVRRAHANKVISEDDFFQLKEEEMRVIRQAAGDGESLGDSASAVFRQALSQVRKLVQEKYPALWNELKSIDSSAKRS